MGNDLVVLGLCPVCRRAIRCNLANGLLVRHGNRAFPCEGRLPISWASVTRNALRDMSHPGKVMLDVLKWAEKRAAP